MARLGIDIQASSVTTPISSYNSAYWNTGNLIQQRLDLTPQFIGPINIAVARPMEAQGGTASGIYPSVIPWSSTVDWVFLTDGAAAAVNRKLKFFTFNKTNSTFNWVGDASIFFPANNGNMTVVGFEMDYQKYSNGQVTVSGNTVNGYFNIGVDPSLEWITDGLSVNSRIGFGSKDPTQISSANWYNISQFLSDTSLTLTTTITSNLSVSTNYVIEDLRALHYCTNATLQNGGLYITKGLSYNTAFSTGAPFTCPSIGGFSTGDGSFGTYWLVANPSISAGQNIVLDVSGFGMAIEPRTNWQTHYAYTGNIWGVNASGIIKIFRYNIRRRLDASTGSFSAYPGRSYIATGNVGVWPNAVDFSTGAQTLAGGVTITKTNNMTYAAHHDTRCPIKDASSLYFVSLTKLYGAPIIATNGTSGISASTNNFVYAAGGMSETPPGTVSMFTATGALACIDYDNILDKFIVTSTGSTAYRSYVTHYGTDGEQFDHICLLDDKQNNNMAAYTNNGSNITPHMNTLSLLATPTAANGMIYITTTPTAFGGTSSQNFLFAIPMGVEWTYSSSTNTVGQIMTPKISTPNCNKYVRVYKVTDNVIGNDIIGKRSDATRISYRTSNTGAGIDDNSGTWTLCSDTNDLSGVAAANYIQFKIEFKGVTDLCIPGRIIALCVVYDDNATDSHFQPSVANSSITNKIFAWRFSTGFGSSPIPALKVVLSDATNITNTYITDYTDTSTLGSFTKTYDGSTWIPYDTSDMNPGNNNIYIRYAPTSLADNLKVKAALMLK